MAVKCILTGQTPSVLDGVTENVQTQLDGKQNKITAEGILQGDGTGGVTAADLTLVSLDKTTVGLGNVDNTSDVNKPISTATQTALDAKQDKITASGLLSGDGAGGVTAAEETEVELVSMPHVVNPNLLDNWYFGNPVNQRGQTSYTGNGYCIDRWKVQNDTSLTVGSGFCTLSGSWDVRQVLENLPQATYTVSVLFKNSTANVLQILLGPKTGEDESIAITQDASGLLVGTSNNIDLSNVIISLSGSGSVDILAVKLELGTEQTLAHQDANGNWVLNEIPDYGEQLRRCQRYFFKLIDRPMAAGWVYNTQYANILINTPVTMRAVPTIKCGFTGAISSITGQKAISELRPITVEANGISCDALSTNNDYPTSWTPVFWSNAGPVELSADL